MQYNKPRPVNWQPTLNYQDKIPFGTYVFYHQLNDIFPGAHVVNTNQSVYSLFSKPLHAGNYIIVAKEVKINKYDFVQLLKYIRAGNTVFITGFDFTGAFNDSLKVKTQIEDDKEKRLLSFTSNQLKKDSTYKFDKDISNRYFSRFDTTQATVISKNNAGNATYLSYKFGRGTLLLCANPKLFSNYSLLTTNGAAYAQRALAYMPLSKNIFWDEYQNHDIQTNTSPMRVFLNNPSLQWGYYLSLFTLLIYVLFEVKRRQRIIPIVEPLKNSTVDFVSVVGRVYFEKRDNANIAYKKILYLLSHLRERYQLKTNQLDSEFMDNLANKTGIPPDFAHELISHVNYVSQQNRVTDHELIRLNQLIEKFYSKS
ncbi:MAG: DUF4350 domain-containing protein [Bacteroidota bacterium]